MAQGKPSKWAQVHISEPFDLGMRGITIKVWDKYGHKHLGYATISIGGVRWKPYKKQKASIFWSWNRLSGKK